MLAVRVCYGFKKATFTLPMLVLCLGLIFGCQNSIDDTPKPVELSSDFNKTIQAFDDLYSRHFVYVLNSIESTRVSDENKIFDEQGVQNLSDNFFKESGVDMEKVKSSSSSRTQVFSDGQLNLLTVLQNDLGTINGPEDAMNIAISFRNKIFNSELNGEEQMVMLAITEYVYIAGKNLSENLMYEYFENGNANASHSSSSRVKGGCSVDWRSAFAGGVASGIVGGIRGGYTGAIGGTVTLPGFGTVGGAVGGAVFGFAAGFTAGVVGGVLKDLIKTCAHYAIKVVVGDDDQMFSSCLTFAMFTDNSTPIYQPCPDLLKFKIILTPSSPTGGTIRRRSRF
jgi:hypothetical protein